MLASSIFSQRRMFETRKKKKGNQRSCWFPLQKKKTFVLVPVNWSNMPSPPSLLENLFPLRFNLQVQASKRRIQITPTPSRPPPSSHKTSPTKQLAASARTAKQLWLVASCPLIPLCPTIITRQLPANPLLPAAGAWPRLAFPCLNYLASGG